MSLFFILLCVFWFVEEGESTPTYLHYLDLGITYERGHFFDVVFCFAIITYLEYFGNLPYICSRPTPGRNKAVSFSRAFSHHVRARGV